MALLIRGGTVVRCDQAGTVGPADVLIEGGRIRAIERRAGGSSGRNGRSAQMSAKDARKSREKGPLHVIDAAGCAVIPGFVQGHVHLCQVLFRGMADDLPLLEWLKLRIWPFEAAHDDASLSASAELGLLEMMLAGTTTILDMGTVHGYDVVFEACRRAGMRVFGGKTMMDAGADVPRGLRETTKASLKEADRLRASWDGKDGGMLRYAYAPRFILSCTEKLFRETAERGANLHTHVSEHPAERRSVEELLGASDFAKLREWGFKGPRTVLAHGVQLTSAEMKIAGRDGTRITHCPSANLKLGSGIARVHAMKKAGVVVALGADGAPCNNNLDPWVEMRHAALLAKMLGPEAITQLPAREAFELATIEGAKALGIDGETGSLEEGKRADVVVVRLDGPHVEPGGDPFSRLVYACTSRDVEHVVANGELVVWKGEHTRLDREKVLAKARAEAKKLSARA